ncbi:MAG TPA: MMPL family transporter [Solirubrobacteraceae bacterium]|nr:MMPL family transporter [Solirubrobacteraceae bacterium]
MSHLLARMARTLTHRWGWSLLAAIVALFLIGAAAGAGGEAADDFEIPGTESQEALDLFRAHSPAFAGADSTLVFSVEDGALTDPEHRAAIEGALEEVQGLNGVAQVADPFAEGGAISEDQRIAMVEVRYDLEPADLDKEDGEALLDAAQTAEDGGVDVSARGILIDLAAEQELPVGELVGVAIALILLTVLFRSLAAMAATLIGALIGVAVGQMLLAALSEPLGLPAFASVIAMMLGLGAGIDYSLLIIGRYREQAAKGDSKRDASAKAAGTSGASVVAAGLIVMVAIAGLLVIGIPFIGKLGLASAIAVGAVVVSALTILPIFIGALGRWIKPKKPEHVEPSRRFERWGETVTTRPWLSIAAGVTVLLIFAFPVLDMRLGQPDDGNQPEERTQRVAYDLQSEAFGPGSNGPFLLAVDIPSGAAENEEQLAALQQAVGDTPGVVSVAPPQVSEDGEMATIFAVPETAPQDKRTSDLLERLREDVIPQATEGTPLRVFVGGNTAGFEDFSDKVASRLPLFIGVVIGLSVLLLIAAFRSLWIPLVSAVFNLLSIAASYGVVTAVFQEGIGASLIGADSGVPVVSFIPVMMFAILFGLSMDYNVFLLSRVHEAYNEGDGPRESVVHGMARIGKVILFAALIMSAVFLAFVTTNDVISKMFGVGLGLAILIDVLIVRLIIAPAVVTLLGDKAWWLPGWLDRLLPNVSLEGHLVESVDERETEKVYV